MPEIVPAYLAHNSNLRSRRTTPSYIVYHTTGRGLSRSAANVADPTSDPEGFDRAAVAWYSRSGAQYYPMYLVGLSGKIFQLAPSHLVTWHAAGPKEEYQGNWSDGNTQWWFSAWPGRRSPYDIVGSGDINSHSIGIDYVPHPAQVGPTPLQLQTIATLAQSLANTNGIALTRDKHLGHSDVDPLGRSTNNAPWDPSWDWTEYMNLLGGSALPNLFGGGESKRTTGQKVLIATSVAGLAAILGIVLYRRVRSSNEVV